MNSTRVVVVVLSNVALAVTVLGWVSQRSARSRFRYKLWRVYDQLVDDVREGRLAAHQPVREYLERLIILVEGTEMLTPYRLIASGRLMRRADVRIRSKDPYRGLNAESRAIMESARCQVYDAIVELFFSGSPSGWALTVAAPVIAVVLRPRPHKSERASRRVAAEWAHQRYGSAVEIVRPLVRPDTNQEQRRPAYV